MLGTAAAALCCLLVEKKNVLGYSSTPELLVIGACRDHGLDLRRQQQQQQHYTYTELDSVGLPGFPRLLYASRACFSLSPFYSSLFFST